MNGDDRTIDKTQSNIWADDEDGRGAPSTEPAAAGNESTTDQAAPGPSEPDWKEEAEKYRDRLLRAQADMENAKKRLEREKTELVKFANENLVKDILPVLDNLERALICGCDTSNNQEALMQGVRLTYEGLINVLEKFGVKTVSAVNQKFDPNFHEAVMQREDPNVDDNSVLAEVQKGYLLHDRLIRPAMVVVSRKPAVIQES